MLLPPGATQAGNGQSDTTSALSPVACRDRLERDNAASLTAPPAADVIRTYTFPATGVASRAHLVVELSSTTVPVTGFAEIAGEIAATLWYDYDFTLLPEAVRQSLDQLQINVLNSVIDALSAGSGSR